MRRLIDRLVDAYMRFRLRHPCFLEPSNEVAFRYYTNASSGERGRDV